MKNLDFAKNLALNYPKLADAKFFDVSADVDQFILELVESEIERVTEGGKTEMAMPISSRPPSDFMCLTYPDHNREGCFILRSAEFDGVSIFAATPSGMHPVGVYSSVDGTSQIDESVPPKSTNQAFMLIATIAYTCALINEPRIVTTEPAFSRQQRRSMSRGMGFAVDAWTRISWDLSKETVAKVSRDPSFHKMPLHWCRGHYRRAQSHYANAIQRHDAFRAEDRDGWWQWIEGVWRGHPAFGVKKSVHAPRISTGELANRKKAA